MPGNQKMFTSNFCYFEQASAFIDSVIKMVGIKRKHAPSKPAAGSKKLKTAQFKATKSTQKPAEPISDELIESDNTEDDADFGAFADGGESEGSLSDDERANLEPVKAAQKPAINGKATQDDGKKFKLETTSAEAHKAQRQLAKERKLAKPNADSIQRSKKIWERLRRKSHVPKEERKALVTELFEIIEGKVRDFVFKHDSVRVIQCALKYANLQQRKLIMTELKGDVRTLAESRYGKFLVAKMVVEGDQDIRDMLIPEFYGHVRRMINHPEASWIIDDIYRQIASPAQKAMMLREWYGAEFALFHKKPNATTPLSAEATADLQRILEASPEKRKPILQYLLQMVNGLIQKKMTGFTMLHDAMLQYFLALEPATPEHAEFLEIIKSDINTKAEGDEGQGGELIKNCCFTKSGSRLVCLAIAYGTAKDRKVLLRCFRDNVEVMSMDQYAKTVLCVAMDVPDDTKMSAKAVLPELLGENVKDDAQREERLLGLVTHLNARLPILYPMAGMAKWLIADADKKLLEEVHGIRKTTSKKAPEARCKELLTYLSPPLVILVEKRAAELVASSFGCQLITEVLLEATGEAAKAVEAVAGLAAGDPTEDGHTAKDAASGRMLKSLVLGGKFDPETKKIVVTGSSTNFGNVLYGVIKEHVMQWACSESSFVVVALLESQVVEEGIKEEILAALKKGRKSIEKASSASAPVKKVDGETNGTDGGKSKKKRKVEGAKGNAGANILLDKIKA